MQISLQINTPVDSVINDFISKLMLLKKVDIFVVSCIGGISNIIVGKQIKDRTGKEIYLVFNCRDKNRIAIFSDLLTSSILGINKILLCYGAHPINTIFTDAKPVFDIEPIHILEIIRKGKMGIGLNNIILTEPLQLQAGFVTKATTHMDLVRIEKMINIGADFIFLDGMDGLENVCRITTLPVYVSLYETEINNLNETLYEIGKKGGSGLNIIVKEKDINDIFYLLG